MTDLVRDFVATLRELQEVTEVCGSWSAQAQAVRDRLDRIRVLISRERYAA